ncbi:unnamed protein product [Ceutorhynchus assimilis]|uniref:Tetraspanin n=1 Tax=Ceutorhynchus assimilis TaxID=467358 RepID=A0A9N9QBN1_9CUCU|nr:unnamed protein product [Ceutorhynchus assimilis]
MCCTETITRILVFVANFAFLLVGVALLSVGILYTIHFTHYTEAIPDQYQAIQYVPTLAIVVGSIIFFIAFLGCCGTIRSSPCMLTTYASILFVIFLLQVALGVFGLLQIKNSSELKVQVSQSINRLFAKYNQTTDYTGVIDLIQQNLKCCGSTGSTSWTTGVPGSCYDEDKNLYAQGCSDAMYSFINGSVRLIAIVALTISLVEIVGAILALCLSNCIRANSRRSGYY